MNRFIKNIFIATVLLALVFSCGKNSEQTGQAGAYKTATDYLGRTVSLPENPAHIICSGAGCLRYLVYLQCQDRLAAVDSLETRDNFFDARAYALANPDFKRLPIFGEMRGMDNPELILTLDPAPDLIFKTYPEMGHDPEELQEKTGIPVIALNYGDLLAERENFYSSLRLMAQIMDKQKRAEAVIAFIDACITDLHNRTKDIKKQGGKTCYIGGIAFKGPLGLQSTETAYPPFVFTGTVNAALTGEGPSYIVVSKEKIVEWDPDIIFIDCATMQSDPRANAVYELKNDPAYGTLKAVKSGEVYAVIPYNWYAQNYGSTLANAYFIGKVLYPEAFADIEPEKKADEIYQFLVGKAVFTEINKSFGTMIFKRVDL
ncbi:MAG: iron ABC transporter substrate-binding protein [Spirochaetales bacterium]|nr:iron ABC transporter substrate-binding protein [Spirochaetales bacterium]